MKILPIIFILICLGQMMHAQSITIDSLSKVFSISTDNKKKVLLLSDIGYYYRLSKPDTAFILSRKALALAKNLNFAEGEANALSTIGSVYRMTGDIQQAMSYQYESLRIAEKYGFENELAKAYLSIGTVYSDIKDFDLAVKYMKRSSKIYEALNKHNLFNTAMANLGEVYFRKNQLDSALYYLQIAHKNLLSNASTNPILPFTYSRLSMVHLKLKNYASAYNYAQKAINMGELDKNIRVQIKGNQITSEYYQSMNKIDSALYFAQKAFDLAKTYDYKWDILENCSLLANLYEKKDLKLAFHYIKYAKLMNDSLYGVDKVNALQKKILEEQNEVKQKEADILASQNRMKQTLLIVGLGILAIIGLILYRNNLQKQKANEVLEKTLSTLKSTQDQLVQSEKMASLGELTAGIAHEIQNPLNFVNNFSELSVDLAKELKEEAQKPVIDKELIIDLTTVLSQNQEKINHHGKRASDIVKGMLEHSRTSTGKKEPTDINALSDEYLRLAYHGLRARDKSFNATMETNFDPALPEIEVVSQDIGRVLLNLITNAFYAVNERSKKGENGYQPTISVSSERVDSPSGVVGGRGKRDFIQISIKDNGSGIPGHLKDKIFQPFFTTKPTGQGTGLGLSLSYDIVKAHGGELKVETKEGEGSIFILSIPCGIK